MVVDVIRHRGEGRALARAEESGHGDQAAPETTELREPIRQRQFGEVILAICFRDRLDRTAAAVRNNELLIPHHNLQMHSVWIKGV